MTEEKNDKIDIKSMNYNEVKEYVKSINEKPFRAKQLYEWIHKNLVLSFDEMTNLSKDFRAKLDKSCTIEGARVIKRQISADGTSKFLMRLSDGNTIVLSGRLDTVTAPQLEAELEKILSDSDALVLDMANLEYISSAGLRVILKAQKAMNTKGTMKLIHVGESIMEVFDITGFSDFLNIE